LHEEEWARKRCVAKLGAKRWAMLAGLRQVELDTNYDPEGGRFANSAGLQLAGLNGTLSNPKYYDPGAKV
jgi:hypothetical protein